MAKNEFKFSDAEVAKRFEPIEVEKDFKLHIPAVKWSGMFSGITIEGAEQLIREGYNRVREIVH